MTPRVLAIGGVRFVAFGGARASRRSDIVDLLSTDPIQLVSTGPIQLVSTGPIQLVSTGRGVAFAANRKGRFAPFKSKDREAIFRGAPFAIFDDDTDATSLDLFTDVSDDDYERIEHGDYDDYE